MPTSTSLFKSLAFLGTLCLGLTNVFPAPAATGIVTGVVIDPATSQPVEYAAVVLKPGTGNATVATAATDARGRFTCDNIPFGVYRLAYGRVGESNQETPVFTLNAAHRSTDLGRLALGGEATLKLERMQVTATKETFYNSIDRKTYNVGKDVQSTTGSASDLLQNVPSISVDIDGNVSLRGSPDVLILINGKSSTLMGRNRAAVLEQLPADGIEKIEVITNPSAKYKPDGTAGIINLTMKHKQDPGYSVSVRASVGQSRRANGSVTANFNPGRLNVFGTFGLRQDDRTRTTTDERTHLDTATNSLVSTSQHTLETSRPLTRLAQTGLDYKLSDDTKLGATFSYNLRDFLRHSTETDISRNSAGAVTSDYDRVRLDPEFEKDVEFGATLQHTWPKTDHELNFSVQHGRTTEVEDNSYRNVYRTPAAVPTEDWKLISNTEEHTEAAAEGVYVIDDASKLELGYTWNSSKLDQDFASSFLDPATGLRTPDPTESNRFLYDLGVHAVYATYGRPFGAFGVLGGLRVEQATLNTDQRTTHTVDQTVYGRLYPTLHLNYNLTDDQQLQLNYSHRVRRPEGDDLNPYPQYQDPFNLRAGNPHLRPEEIHSVEAGYQFKRKETTLLAAVYYRYRYDSITSVTRYIDATTLLTTRENIGSTTSTGLELAATGTVAKAVSLNFSANLYRNEIDASNLGFSDRKAAFAWEAKFNANWNVTKTTLVQLNTNYSAKRLTPQGYRYPTCVMNLGLRHNFADKKTSFVLTISDLLDSAHERTLVDVPGLHDDSTRRRSARIVYAGFIYSFGQAVKRKDDLQFDNQP